MRACLAARSFNRGVRGDPRACSDPPREARQTLRYIRVRADCNQRVGCTTLGEGVDRQRPAGEEAIRPNCVHIRRRRGAYVGSVKNGKATADGTLGTSKFMLTLAFSGLSVNSVNSSSSTIGTGTITATVW